MQLLNSDCELACAKTKKEGGKNKKGVNMNKKKPLTHILRFGGS